MKKYKRPWGYYKILYSCKDYLIKEITIKPKQRISLQKHLYRNEFWEIIQGIGTVTIKDIEVNSMFNVIKESNIRIPKECVHRIENISDKEDLLFIEIQTGEKLDENDIVRIEDDYKRI